MVAAVTAFFVTQEKHLMTVLNNGTSRGPVSLRFLTACQDFCARESAFPEGYHDEP
jgi:hypothetical protein